MEARASGCAKNFGLKELVYDEINSDQRYQDLRFFFQAAIPLIPIISSLALLLSQQVPCEETPVRVPLLSAAGGCILPSPYL